MNLGQPVAEYDFVQFDRGGIRYAIIQHERDLDSIEVGRH